MRVCKRNSKSKFNGCCFLDIRIGYLRASCGWQRKNQLSYWDGTRPVEKKSGTQWKNILKKRRLMDSSRALLRNHDFASEDPIRDQMMKNSNLQKKNPGPGKSSFLPPFHQTWMELKQWTSEFPSPLLPSTIVNLVLKCINTVSYKKCFILLLPSQLSSMVKSDEHDRGNIFE